MKASWRAQSDKFWDYLPEEFEISRFLRSGDGIKCIQTILSSKFLRDSPEVCSLHLLANIHVSSEAVALAALEELPLSLIPVDTRRGPMVEYLTRAAELPRFAAAAAGALVQISTLFKPDAFQARMQTVLLKLAAMPDRGVRYKLVTGMGSFLDLMEKKAFEKDFIIEIFSGFSDSHPAIREATLRAVLVFAPKLKPSTLMSKLLPHVTRLQKDPEAPIRMHACIAVGKIASLVEADKIPEIISAAVLPCLSDPFDQTRLAAVAVIANVSSACSLADLATRILPALCPLLTDTAAGEAVHDLINQILQRTKPEKTPTNLPPVQPPMTPPKVPDGPKIQAVQKMPKIAAPVVKKPVKPDAADEFWAELEKSPEKPPNEKSAGGWDLDI